MGDFVPEESWEGNCDPRDGHNHTNRKLSGWWYKSFLKSKKCKFNSIHHFSEKIRQSKRDDLLIILTGAFLPESFKNSDADFNIGLAIGNIEHLRDKYNLLFITGGISVLKSGVFVALNGSVSF